MLSCWKYRRLTLLGKITVLNSLVVSQLVYVLTPLKSNYSALTEINKLLYTFLRNGKGDKIKRNVIINDYCDGGLKMIDIFSFNKSRKATWIKKYLDNSNNGNGNCFWIRPFKITVAKVFCPRNLNVRDTLDLTKVSDDVFRELLERWGEINFEKQITSENHLLDQPLWFNSLIRIDNKPVFFKEWFAKGITTVKHLLRMGTNIFLSLNDFCQKYNL